MGNTLKINKVNFEDIQTYIQANERKMGEQQQIFLINTLPLNEQHCLIPFTLSASDEEHIVNKLLKNTKIKFIIYGKNANDNTIQIQYTKLYNLGFQSGQLYIYLGGIFEWLLLQDVYGKTEFPTTSTEHDILKYKPKKTLFISTS